MTVLHHIPIALTALRFALGPVVLALAFYRPVPNAFAACLLLAVFSDYFDGVIARRLGIATPNLRRLDSLADSVFYISALGAAWHLHSTLLQPHLVALSYLLALEIIR
jgi:phosphatidylglycerophosphate synthase